MFGVQFGQVDCEPFFEVLLLKLTLTNLRRFLRFMEGVPKALISMPEKEKAEFQKDMDKLKGVLENIQVRFGHHGEKKDYIK